MVNHLISVSCLLAHPRRRSESHFFAAGRRCRSLASLTPIVKQGFGESPYLRKKLTEWYEPQRIKIVTADEPSKKAVAEGDSHPYF